MAGFDLMIIVLGVLGVTAAFVALGLSIGYIIIVLLEGAQNGRD